MLDVQCSMFDVHFLEKEEGTPSQQPDTGDQ
jgi:hypothetical protein